MTPTELQTLIHRYSAEGLVAPAPLVRHGGASPDGTFIPFGVVADLVVDLAVTLADANQAGLEALDIYADTLLVPEGFDQRLDGSLRRLTIATRRIVTEGKTALRMLHDEGNQLSSVRLFVEKIEGQFALYGGPQRNTPYALVEAAASARRPQFTNFLWQDQQPVIKFTDVPPGLLLYGEPLHRVLATLFALAAGVAGKPAPSTAELALCHDSLAWITRWSGVESEFGELIHVADALKGLLPVLAAGGLTRPIPDLSAANYLELAKTQKDVMAALEANLRSIESAANLADALGGVVLAFADRDTFELDKLKAQCGELEQRLVGQMAALDKAARTVRQEEFAAEIAAIRLNVESSVAEIIRTVKMSFEIAFGILAVAGSVAALCVGVPPDPAALTETGLKGVLGLKDMYTKAGALGSTIDGPLAALKALAQSFAIPLEWAKHNASTLKNFADPAKGVLNAVLPVIRGPLNGLDTEQLAKELGDTMRALALTPDANEAKAAWLALENDAVNRLDLIIHADSIEPAVRNAANTLKSQVQKVAIYGRLLAEQAAAKSAIATQLAALKLEYVAVIGKRKRLETLAQQNVTQVERSTRLRAETALRSEGAMRGFFLASYGARAAQAYETFRQPTNRLQMLGAAAAMADAHATLLADHASTQAASAKQKGDLRRELRITDTDLLHRLTHGQPVSVTIGTGHADLASYHRIRLSSVQAWLEYPGATARRVNIDLVTGSSFLDSTGKEDEQLFSTPQRINFTYAGQEIEFAQTLQEVRPTPFTTWLIELVEPQPLAEPLQALRLVLSGTATK